MIRHLIDREDFTLTGENFYHDFFFCLDFSLAGENVNKVLPIYIAKTKQLKQHCM